MIILSFNICFLPPCPKLDSVSIHYWKDPLVYLYPWTTRVLHELSHNEPIYICSVYDYKLCAEKVQS
jgi:hypothetical protein